MSVIAPAPRVLSAVLLLSVVCCSPARADWCHGGEVPAIEWLVDASNVVAAEVVEVPGGYNMYRVTEILKRSKPFSWKEGDVIDSEPLWLLTRDGWKHRDPIVMFLGNDTTVARAVVNLIRPQNVWGKPEKTYLAVDKHGKRVPDRDDFMRRVRERIEKLDGSNSGFLPIREDGYLRSAGRAGNIFRISSPPRESGWMPWRETCGGSDLAPEARTSSRLGCGAGLD